MSDEPVELAVVLARRWRTVLACLLLGLAGGVAYALLAPEWYSATLTVVPAQRSQDSAAMVLAAKLPIGLDTLQTDVQRIQAVLASASVADEVIEKFALDARYGTAHREQTRTALAEHCASFVDRKSGVVSLTCEDKDPGVAKAIAESYGEIGNRVFGRVSVSSAREERAFLEQQVVKARHDVDEASRKLREFQEQHKIIDLPEQSRAVISAMAQIKGEMVSKQIELGYLSGFSGRGESNVQQLEQQIAVMSDKLRQLEETQQSSRGSAAGSASGSANFFPNAMTVPELRFELEQLMREQKIEETVFGLMTQRYEMAKVDEARDTSTFQILDHPTLPTYRSRPRRTRSALVGVGAGFLVACAWILLPAWWRRRVVTA
ncbi:MAG TPA: Wzz/FepE/Etk N-terminal domain-containing protein [Kofleriaceae bacterium]|nr:Wzz/FepE/Etk N-terminal domain-containing protein [Kofleriaceae bacterium]